MHVAQVEAHSSTDKVTVPPSTALRSTLRCQSGMGKGTYWMLNLPEGS